MLSDTQWQRAKSIAMDAMELPVSERLPFVIRACAEDDPVRKEVESLLGGSDDDVKLPEPIEAQAAATAPPPSGGSMLVGKRLGRYLITRLIGMGGMGAVYEARQDGLARPVALKVMRAGLLSTGATSRFQREARFLSRLDHPGIARIYDSAIHESELGPIPYFAMELIQNPITITEFAEDQSLSIRDRIEMFERVCEAVHHGHQRGIIHRDIKPSNILVSRPLGQDPTPHGVAQLDTSVGQSAPADPGSMSSRSIDGVAAKVIDFGIARSTDADITLATFETSLRSIAGTLSYMSPEQCSADPAEIDIRSDVYSLGVVLHELLFGRLPYDLSGKPITEAIRIIREVDPFRYHSPDSIVPTDLKVIVGKCLAKEKKERYASAVELASDLRAWLEARPIAARPASRFYAMRLFARRNRSLVAFTLGAIFFGSAALIVTTLSLVRAVAERDRANTAQLSAEDQARRARSASEFLQEVLRSTTYPLMLSEFSDPSISPISGSLRFAPGSNSTSGRAGSMRDIIARARSRLDAGALTDPILGSELRLVTLQLLLGQPGSSEEIRRLMSDSPAEVESCAALLGRTHPSVMVTSLMLARTMWGNGIRPDAIALVEPLYAAAVRDFGPGDPKTLEIGRQLVSMLEKPEQLPRRRVLCQYLLRNSTITNGEHARCTLACRATAAWVEVADGKNRLAASEGRAIVSILGPEAPETDELLHTALQLSIVDVTEVPATRANLLHLAAVRERVLRGVREATGHDARRTFDVAGPLVVTLVQLGEFKHAASVMKQLADDALAAFGPGFHVTTKCQSRVARLLLWAGEDLTEAIELADLAWRNGVAVSGTPLGDYEVFDRATVLDIRRAAGESADALKEVDQIIQDYRSLSGGNLSWFGGYLHSIAATALEQEGRPDEAAPRWEAALEEVNEHQPENGTLRVMVLRGAARFFAVHGPRDQYERVRAMLGRVVPPS